MSFSTVKKGYDSGEVTAFVQEVATALEDAQNETTAMEARARAAVARLQELSQAAEQPAGDVDAGDVDAEERAEIKASVDETETISRTLLLAQRTADTTVAEADAEAERILSTARDDAAQSLDQARVLADRLIEDAKNEARRAGEGERIRVESEVQALNARRDFLESDVDHLESFLIEQRQRIRESATTLSELVDRVPGGLGAVHRPLLSAAGSDDGDADEDDTQPYESFSTDATDIDDVDDSDGSDGSGGDVAVGTGTGTETDAGTDDTAHERDPDSTPAGTSPGRDSLFPEQHS